MGTSSLRHSPEPRGVSSHEENDDDDDADQILTSWLLIIPFKIIY